MLTLNSLPLILTIISSQFFHVTLEMKEELGSLCDSKIYCNGNLLHAIQMSFIFNDSKTFVDMPTKQSEENVIKNFAELGTNPSKGQIETFLNENFHEPGYDLIQTTPVDWQSPPPYLYLLNQNDSSLIKLAEKLNLEWKSLLRKFDSEKLCKDCVSSSVETNNSFIVPGGRFIEYYYWDSYWVIEALLSSKMFVTSKGIVQNFLDIVKQKGFVPNGARIYYLNRSQPPLLIQMFYAYFMATKDTQFLLNSIDLLEREYLFWMSNKHVTLEKNGKTYELNSYNVTSTIPRPESYREDFVKANESSNATRYYSNVMSAAESGFDFSSRWFSDPQDIRTIAITDMIPVDLNAIMYRNEFILAELFGVLNNKNKSEEYERAMQRREEAINEFLWDSKLNTWADLNLITNKLHTDYLYITDLAPLWFNVKPKVDPKIILARYDSLLMSHVSGIPASNIHTGQQWDFPNIWAPYHTWIVDYLRKNVTTYSKSLDIAQRFVTSVYCGWKKTGYFFEKYNADVIGGYGEGGEYVVQDGFGWTNSAVIKFMEWFGKDLKINNDKVCESVSNQANARQTNGYLFRLSLVFQIIVLKEFF